MPPISQTRDTALATYSAEWLTIGAHIQLDVSPDGDFIEKPDKATHLKIQVLIQNIRYLIDGKQALVSFGFQLAAGAETTLPVPNLGVSVFEEAPGAIIEYQWLG